LDIWDSFDKKELSLPNVESFIFTGPHEERALSSSKEINADTLNHIYIRTGGTINHPLAFSRRDMGVAIRELKRTEKIQKMIHSFDESNYVGVYIQNNPDVMNLYSGDSLSESERQIKSDAIKASQTSIFITEMHRILVESPDVLFYVSADSVSSIKTIRDHFKQLKKNPIVYLESRGDCYTQAKVS
jgi:hypothetical protein